MLLFALASLSLCAPAPPVFEGKTLGVSARVTIETKRHAYVELQGAPLGGRLAGIATLDQFGSCCMDAKLAGALRARGCRIGTIAPRNSMESISVVLGLPMLGRRVLQLQRVESAAEPQAGPPQG